MASDIKDEENPQDDVEASGAIDGDRAGASAGSDDKEADARADDRTDGGGAGASWWSRIHWRSPFFMDLRGIAVLRIGLGLLILADLINRSRDFAAFYTDDGVLPRADWIRRTNEWHWSLHASVGNDWLVSGLFVLAAVLAVMLIVGYRSRIAALLSFLLMCSLHSRNFMVLQGGDTAFRMLVFWSMFLPLGARWSIESVARDKKPRSNQFHSMATVGILLLVVSVYLGAMAHKLGQPIWWKYGKALHYALNTQQFTTHVGLWLASQGWLTTIMTYVTLVVQGTGAALLVVPGMPERARIVVPLMLIGFHLSIAACMQIGLFSFIMVVLWLPVMPDSAWSWIERRILDNPVTQWCRAKLSFLTGWLIARERRRIADSPVVPLEKAGTSRPAKIAAALAICTCAWWNLGTYHDRLKMPAQLQAVARTMRLEQKWNMFSNPPRYTDWYVIPGELANKKTVDIFRDGAEVDKEKPELVSALFPSQRWRKYLNNLRNKRHRSHRRLYAAYLCRWWNHKDRPRDERLVKFELIQMRQASPKTAGAEQAPPREISLLKHRCPR